MGHGRVSRLAIRNRRAALGRHGQGNIRRRARGPGRLVRPASLPFRERRRVSLARAAVVATAVVATPAIGLIIGGQGAIALASTVGLGGVLVAAQTLWVSLADPFKRSVESFAAKSQIPHGDGFSLAAAGQVDSLMELLLRKGGRLAIFIDDLDRCSPDNLVRVIEA